MIYLKARIETTHPAKRDPKAPHGWATDTGMFYRPDWGDRLFEIDGEWFISVGQLFPVEPTQ
ncbi:hypothetical protein ACQ4M4_25845 [Leptolyngbya sp. AN02str]|uniref:hypothetical protein n=1 Tax=Leptolyngbya sp. AN02str TaxID=3423363 RepID=UPI003D30F4AE